MRVVIAALLLLLPSHAFGWGSQGHQAIADAAQTCLDEKAQAALARILVGGHSVTLPPGKLAIASTWPDEVRGLKSLGVPFGWESGDVPTRPTGGGTSSTCPSGRRAIRRWPTPARS